MIMESSTEIPAMEPPKGIPDDVFQAVLDACQYDSDGENPFEPQPKRFMQTEDQNRRQERDLEIRQMAWIIRKMRRIHKANHQRLKKKQRSTPPFEKLPSDLVLKLMQHTHLRNIFDLVNSSAINQSIFKANQKAILRGMEIEQFPEWRWLFGDSKYRNLAQSQHLKDAILSEKFSLTPGAHGLAYDEQLVEILRMIDNDEFTGVRNVMFLQDMQDRVDVDVKAIESYTRKKITRRAAICLRSLSFQRPDIVNEDKWTEYRQLVNALEVPWEARSHLVKEQPASIQAEVRLILGVVVEKLYNKLQEVVISWFWWHYRSPGKHRKPQEMKKWMSKLVTGLILEAVIPQWHAKTADPSPPSSFPPSYFAWQYSYVYLTVDSSVYLTVDLRGLLDQQDEGNVDVLQKVKSGVNFGQSIGMDLEVLLDKTSAGDYLESFDLGSDEGF